MNFLKPKQFQIPDGEGGEEHSPKSECLAGVKSWGVGLGRGCQE